MYSQDGEGEEVVCLQCATKSKIFATKEEPNFLPRYSLQIATISDSPENATWAAGEYGLIRCNNPDYIFYVDMEVEEYNKMCGMV
jgi:hypothetical protein